MSAHVWRARLEYAARAHSCGHISNVSLSVDTTRALDTCTKCGCGSAGASVLDRVPTPDMTWSGAVCSKSLQLKPRTGGKVSRRHGQCLDAVRCATPGHGVKTLDTLVYCLGTALGTLLLRYRSLAERMDRSSTNDGIRYRVADLVMLYISATFRS